MLKRERGARQGERKHQEATPQQDGLIQRWCPKGEARTQSELSSPAAEVGGPVLKGRGEQIKK